MSVAACGETENAALRASIAEGCAINSDCSSPLVCAFRTCHVECASTRDCVTYGGGLCVQSDKPYRVCQNPTEATCVRNSDCPGSQVCGQDLHCRDACVTERDCLEGQLCATGTCAEPAELIDGVLPSKSKPVGGASCARSSECPGTLICLEGACVDECKGDKDCQYGFGCLNARCVPKPSAGGAGGGAGAGAGGSGGASASAGAAGRGGETAGGAGSGGGTAGTSGSGGLAGSGGQAAAGTAGVAGQGGMSVGGEGGQGGGENGGGQAGIGGQAPAGAGGGENGGAGGAPEACQCAIAGDTCDELGRCGQLSKSCKLTGCGPGYLCAGTGLCTCNDLSFCGRVCTNGAVCGKDETCDVATGFCLPAPCACLSAGDTCNGLGTCVQTNVKCDALTNCALGYTCGPEGVCACTDESICGRTCGKGFVCPADRVCDPASSRCLLPHTPLRCLSDAFCAAGSTCVDQLCLPLGAKAVGATCGRHEECATGRCGGVCLPACERESDCGGLHCIALSAFGSQYGVAAPNSSGCSVNTACVGCTADQHCLGSFQGASKPSCADPSCGLGSDCATGESCVYQGFAAATCHAGPELDCAPTEIGLRVATPVCALPLSCYLDTPASCPKGYACTAYPELSAAPEQGLCKRL
jgi:hypothetical protein